MGFEAWLTLIIVGLLVTLLALTRIAADIIFAGCLTLLLLFGVVTPGEALSGLANQGMVTVGVLYVVVAGLRETGGIHWISQRLLGVPGSLVGAQLRLMLPVTFLSAFLNNTPVVAMLIPAVGDWAKKHDLAASKLMLPLSYAAILGGTCTLIGTSTNLVVNGLLLEHSPGRGLGMFELAWVGLPAALAGIALIVLLSRWLLPDKRSAMSTFRDPREYSVEMLVESGGPLVGKSIEEAGLRHLAGMYLAEIERDGQVIPAVAPEEALQAHDRLVFVGVVESVVELQRIRGLTPATEQVFKLDVPRPRRTMVEAVVSNSGPLVGKTIREGRFRSVYDAVVIAVARNGTRVDKKIGDIVLQPGDTLLLEAKASFADQQRNSRDFYLVSSLDDSHPLRHERAAVALGILGVMVTVVTIGWLSMLEGALVAAGLMLITRCCTGAVARRSVDWSILMTIAAAFGIGVALDTSGAAEAVALSLTGLAGDTPYLNLIAIYLVTALFSSVVTNNAAAVLMFPIASALAETLGVSVMPFAVAIMMAASASFATPIGYQTNLMVYGPGGYSFSDYLKLGLPLNLATAAVALGIIPLVWTF